MKSKKFTQPLLLLTLALFALLPADAMAQRDYTSDEIIGQWEVLKVTEEDGTVVKEQPEGMRDQIEFMDNYTVAIIKGEDKGLGMWKFYSNRITVADRASQNYFDFEVVSITETDMQLRLVNSDEKLIVHYRRL